MANDNTEIALVEVPEEFKSKVAVFSDRKQFDALYKACEDKAAEAGTDVSTKKARDEIVAVAFKIRKIGVVVDESGGALAEDMRSKVKAIDTKRREYKSELVDLADKVRKPVTDWEAAEEAKKQKRLQGMRDITECGNVAFGETAAQILARKEKLQAIIVDAEYGDLEEQARDRHTAAMEKLEIAHTAAVEAAERAAELEDLRKSQAAQAAKDAEEKAERDRKAAAEQKQRDEEQAAEQKKRDDEREAEKAKAAEQQAKIDALQREADAAKAKAAQLEREQNEAKQREADRIAADKKKKADDKAEADRKKAAAKLAEEQHETRVAESVAGLDAIGVSKTMAKMIVNAIVEGAVPHVTFG